MITPAADELDWPKGGGLLPAIVQHALTGQVLMLAYMNRESFGETIACGEAVFFSRSRDQLWRKGESSGHVLKVTEIRKDCDADSLLVRALPAGPTCHLGMRSCFGDVAPATVLEDIEAVIASRLAENPDGSYVAKLAAAGPLRVAQKLGEEGVETALAAVAGNDDALVAESADLVFHLLVMLQVRGLSLEAVLEQLAARRR